MVMHTAMSNAYTSIEREFKKQLSDRTRTHGFIDHGKDRNIASNHKWTEHEYHVHDGKYVQ